MAKAKSSLKTYLLLTILFTGVFSAFLLSKPICKGSCLESIITVYPGQSISEAINNASEGDTILVEPGTYFESKILVNKAVTIIGENAESTIIDGNSTADNIFQVIADNVTIEKFTINNTDPDPFSYSSAIQIYNATNVTVKNVIISNVVIGVEIRSSNNSKVMYSKINRSIWGIRLRDSSCNSTIVGNTLEQNPTAISFDDYESRYGRVYHNNFINNTNHISYSYLPITYFDDDYPSCGNYWSGYSAIDVKFGPSQNETGSDGILDLGYPDSYNPWDKYPFANPLTIFNASADGQTFIVQVSTNLTVTTCSLNESEKSLNLFADGLIDTVGACRVAIPKELLACENLSDWTVSIYSNGGGEPLPLLYFLPLDNAEKTYLFFTYNHTTANDRIKIVIPEFSSITVLIVLLITVTLAIAALKAICFKIKKD